MNIIAVCAHLDDIELACGGTLAKAAINGHKVRMCVLSKSDYTHYNGSKGRSALTAYQEGSEAAGLLGLEPPIVYDFPAKDIPNDSSVVEVLNREFDEFMPDLILTHWQFDTHKSHMNTALATFAAARYHPSIAMFEPFPPAGRSYAPFRPQLYVDITDTIDLKIQALSCHRSELAKYGEGWVDSIRARAMLRGFEMISQKFTKAKYAEVFEVVRLNYGII